MAYRASVVAGSRRLGSSTSRPRISASTLATDPVWRAEFPGSVVLGVGRRSGESYRNRLSQSTRATTRIRVSIHFAGIRPSFTALRPTLAKLLALSGHTHAQPPLSHQLALQVLILWSSVSASLGPPRM